MRKMTTVRVDETGHELFWICGGCTFRNTHLNSRTCSSCGTARPFHDRPQQSRFWHCLFCAKVISVDYEVCGSCALRRTSWTCRSCGVEYSPAVTLCTTCNNMGLSPDSAPDDGEPTRSSNNPASFRSTHPTSARSATSTSNSSSFTNRNATKNKWACSMCSFENSTMDAIACEMCLFPRESSRPVPFSSSISQDGKTRGDGVGDQSWTCSQCTLINSSQAIVCSACESSRISNGTTKSSSSTSTRPSMATIGPLRSNPIPVKESSWMCGECGRAVVVSSIHKMSTISSCPFCGTPRCAECKRTITVRDGNYIQDGNRNGAQYFHETCFRCAGCNRRILPGASYTRVGDMLDPYHLDCHSQLFGVQCRVCEKSIPPNTSYRKDPFWEDAYCEHHEREFHSQTPDALYRCLGCQRIWPTAKAEVEMIHLSPSHHICRLCVVDAVLHPSPIELDSIQRRILNFFQVLGLNIPQKNIPVQVVDPAMMLRMCSYDSNSKMTPSSLSHTLGTCESVLTHLMMDGRRLSTAATVERISMMNGLPLVVFEDVLCHEMMHAYLKLNDFDPDMEPAVEEGLCQLMSYLWLKDGNELSNQARVSPADSSEFLQQHQHANKVRMLRLKALETGEDPVYGEGFRQSYTAFLQARCLDPLLRYVKEFRVLPPV